MSEPSSLLELFREEVRAHAQTLSEGLVALEQHPGDAGLLEALMRAAHSIKGAARVIDVRPAVPLAHALESCLVAAQHGQISLVPEDIDLFLETADLLGQIGEHAGDGLEGWLADQGDTRARLTGALEARAAGGETPAGTAGVRPAPREAPLPEKPAEEPTEEGSAAEEASLALTPSPLLELFREEVRTHTQTLSAGLAALEQRPDDADLLQGLMRAVRAIRGAARVVEVQPPVPLADAMEGCLGSARQGRLVLTGEDLALLRQGAEVLADLGEHLDEGFAGWLRGRRATLHELTERLRARAEGPPAPPRGEVVKAEPALEVVLSPYPVVEMETAVAALPGGAPEPAAALPGAQAAADVVRVSAQSLTRLMGLAGESLVEARWLEPFASELLRLKRHQGRLADVLDQLWQTEAGGGEGAHALVGAAREHLGACQRALAERIAEFEAHARQANDLNSRLYREVIASRMRPFADGAQGFPRLVRDLARELGKQVRFEVAGQHTEVDRDILEKLDAPLTHLLRNALDHALEAPGERRAAGKPEAGTLTLEAGHAGGMLSIRVSDDGRGIDVERLRRKVVERGLTTGAMATRMSDAELLEFLFLPGFSTAEHVTEVSGRGVGLDVVHHVVTSVGGSVSVRTRLGRGTSFHLRLPVTLSVIRAVLVEVGGEPYAFPHTRIDRLLRLGREEVTSLESRQYFTFDGRNVGLVLGAQALGLEAEAAPGDDLYVVVFSYRHGELGMVVDGFRGEQDLVVRPLDARLGKVPNVSAAALLDDGSPVLIVDLEDLGRSIDKILHGGQLQGMEEESSPGERRRRILVVDDSITVREVQRQVLGNQGYEVETAVDGMDAWNLLRRRPFDLVISDIDMPRMNGLDLVKQIRQERRFEGLPVIIVSYKDRPEDRLRGLEVGASCYLTKSSFHDETLLRAVTDLIGKP